jgi:uncharacterized protein YndB with AHSA1/START domain
MIEMKRDVLSTTDREITLTRVYDAPRERVFEVWTRPEHISRWWGPHGFTTVTESMDVRPGGTWKYVMKHAEHGEFDNLITYREVVRPERLVYSHGTSTETEQFHVTVTFAEQGGKTRLTMHSVWPSAEAFEAVRKFGVEKGGNETLDRLTEHLAQRA